MRRVARFALYGLGGLAALFLVLASAGLIVVQTSWFRNKVRERIVYEIEKATGGRSELGAFDFDWRSLAAQVRTLVIHGTEGPGEAPLFRADLVRVELRIVSLLEKKLDLASVLVLRPQVNVIVYEDGRTNLPKPKVPRKPGRNTAEVILDLAVKRFTLINGAVQVGMRGLPLNLRGENVRARVFYEPAPARYRGALAFRSLDVRAGGNKPLPIDVDAKLVLERDRLDIQGLHLAANASTLDLKGAVDHFASPRIALDYAARVNLKQPWPGLSLRPLLNRGTLALSGRAAISGASDYAITGTLLARGLAFQERGIFIDDIRADSAVAMSPGRIEFRDLSVRALHGSFDGRAEISGLRDFRVDGGVRRFALHEMTRLQGVHRMVWTGAASGPVQLAGKVLEGKLAALHLQTELGIAPAPGEDPVEGLVRLAYDHASGTLSFGPSNLTTRFSHIDFSGVLGRRMNAAVETTNLDDARPAIAIFTVGPPPEMPVRLLPNGVAKFQGTVDGPLKNPTIRGRASMTNFTTAGRQFDSAEADVSVSSSGAVARDAVFTRLGVRASGNVSVGFRDWKPEPGQPLAATLSVRSPSLAAGLAAANVKSPVDAAAGSLTAAVTLGGTIAALQVSGHALAADVVLYGQPIARLEGDLRYTADSLEVVSAQLDSGPSHARVSARFDHPNGNWSEGRVRFHVASRGIYLPGLTALRDTGLEGRIETQLAGEVTLGHSGFRPGAFNGSVRIRDLALGGEQLGSLQLTAATAGTNLGLRLEGDLAGSKVNGTSDWTLEGNYPARGHLEFTPLRFSTLLARLNHTPGAARPPFDGSVAGFVDFSGNTPDPKSWKASAHLRDFELQPAAGFADVPNAPGLVLRNSGPVLLDIDSSGARVRQARFLAKDTSLGVTGRIGFGVRNPWDVRVQGTVNLALLRDFEDQLYSSGSLVVDVSVRGSLAKPDVYGRVDLRNASVNLANFPNGIANANGVIFLYRDRAMIETLTGASGGGTISVTGFVSFAGVTTFHLQAKAADVRVRYPEGVSSTSNAALTFTGTADRSVLSGDVTLTRMGFNPRSDLGTILASAAQPVTAPAQPSRFRQGLRFDVRITTAPEVRLETKLTKDIQADASLRLRGDSTHPILLGRVSISQGEVMFFGNKYTINTGQVLFVNASRIEPTVSLDLETRARGVEVTLHVSGPANKLNVSYRSDPPLAFAEIVALLTTGREPALTPGTSGSQSQVGQTWQQAGASALLSQAITSPIAGRLQRFFGVSRLKIDPQVTGLTTSNAAARLTLEQNITSNLTFTYITDLSRAQAQTVRIEWDLSHSLSGVAVREENGLFGIDFVYRKQLK